jgi:hypothetical protein
LLFDNLLSLGGDFLSFTSRSAAFLEKFGETEFQEKLDYHGGSTSTSTVGGEFLVVTSGLFALLVTVTFQVFHWEDHNGRD